jgi:hypothetical protein
MSGSPNYWFRVFTGIFEHRKKIGAAIWVFLWCVANTTQEATAADGRAEGLVLGGHPVPLKRIALELDMSTDAVYEHLVLLADAGYIRKLLHGNGRPNGYAVVNSKRFNRRTNAGGLELQPVVQKPEGTVVQNAVGTVVQKPDDPRAFSGGPSYKSPSASINKEKRRIEKNNYEPIARTLPPPDDEKIDTTMAVSGVIEMCELYSRDARMTLEDLARQAEKQGQDLEAWVDSMVKAWKHLVDSRPKLEYAWSAQKFFGEGHYKNPAGWPWKPGSAPPRRIKVVNE